LAARPDFSASRNKPAHRAFRRAAAALLILDGEKTSAIRTVAAVPWLHWTQRRGDEYNATVRPQPDYLVKPYSGIPRGDFESFANFGTISATPSWLAECFYFSRTELELQGLSLFR
jgi:hypothetical protein